MRLPGKNLLSALLAAVCCLAFGDDVSLRKEAQEIVRKAHKSRKGSAEYNAACIEAAEKYLEAVKEARSDTIRNNDGTKTDDDCKIVNPHLVILGTAIPKFFYSALSERVLANGLIARCMILDAGKRGHGRKPSGESIPGTITRTIEIISQYGQSGNLTEINPAPMQIPATPDADALLSKLNEKYDCIYDRHEAEQRNEAMAFWARVFEVGLFLLPD